MIKLSPKQKKSLFRSRRKKIQVSKYMSLLLRHRPENLDMDAQGRVLFSSFLRHLQIKWPWLTKEHIQEIVFNSDKKRFKMENDKIYAVYGHSLEDLTLEYPEVVPPRFLYHGTPKKNVNKIKNVGLEPMSRRYVHLSLTPEEAVKVGQRRDKSPAILKIDAKKANLEGLKFYQASPEIYLCSHVPAKYILFEPLES
ncbi:MAG: RNA 2'-phosphotransferase [Promethearchaeota archaeon]